MLVAMRVVFAECVQIVSLAETFVRKNVLKFALCDEQIKNFVNSEKVFCEIFNLWN